MYNPSYWMNSFWKTAYWLKQTFVPTVFHPAKLVEVDVRAKDYELVVIGVNNGQH